MSMLRIFWILFHELKAFRLIKNLILSLSIRELWRLGKKKINRFEMTVPAVLDLANLKEAAKISRGLSIDAVAACKSGIHPVLSLSLTLSSLSSSF
jgi:hypothetical protein